MDMLKSEQSRLCLWLSEDPGHILDQCGDVLSLNEYKEIQKQQSALDKMRLLLKIILRKGGKTCQSFVDILKQNQAHYQQLQQYFNPQTQGSLIPGVVADGSSVVIKRGITDTTAKCLSVNIETVSSHSSENVAVPHAAYVAQGGSVICADTFSGVTVDGDFNLSVCVRPPPVQAGATDGTELPSPQGPAGERITEYKLTLIDCLKGDLFILQHVHAKRIVTDREYLNLKHASHPEQTVIDLIDHVIRKGEEKCVKFLKVLKDPDVLNTYPKLKEIPNIDS